MVLEYCLKNGTVDGDLLADIGFDLTKNANSITIISKLLVQARDK